MPASAAKRAAARQMKAQLVAAVRLDLRDQVIAVLDQANSKTAKTLIAFAQAIEAGFDGAGSKMASMHTELAAEAHQAVKLAYANARARGAHTEDYRASGARNPRNRRYAGNMLASALEDEDFVSADAKGIYFADTSSLDQVAKQWYRLNFGAGGAAGQGPGSYTVRWSNLDAFSLGFEDQSPSAGFSLPGGRWRDGKFMPLSEVPQGWTHSNSTYQRPVATRGIRGEHWLEAGLQVIAAGLPAAYQELFDQIWDDAKAKAGTEAAAGTTGLKRPGRPRSSIAAFNEEDPELTLGPGGSEPTGDPEMDRTYPSRSWVDEQGQARSIIAE